MKDEKYIVYVDDDEDDRFIFQQVFESVKDYSFLTVESGAELFQLLERKDASSFPCLIVCDMNMPLQNGVEVLRSLRQQHQYDPIPVVMFTTSKNPLEEEQCKVLGAAVEVKPADMEEMNAVTSLLLQHCRE